VSGIFAKGSATLRCAVLVLVAAFVAAASLLLAGPSRAAQNEYRVNAGGNALPQLAQPWSGDTKASPSPYVNAGSVISPTSGAVIDTSHPSVPKGTPKYVFQTERFDPAAGEEMAWDFPVDPGQYQVRLYFAETFAGAHAEGVRLFDVSIEGALKLDDYDVFKAAGAGNKGVVETFKVESSDGNLDIDFGHVADKNNPSIKGIEILPVESQAFFAITPNACRVGSACDPEKASTVTATNSSFKVQNTSPADSGKKITNVKIDLGDTLLPDMVFDPKGQAGDSKGGCLDPDDFADNGVAGPVASADPCGSPTFGEGSAEGGYKTLEMAFDNFDPGEDFTFSADVDPTTIKGSPTFEGAGAVSGLELTGARITVTFDDGTTRTAQTFGNSAFSSKNTAGSNPPAAPEISGPNGKAPSKVSAANQTVTVKGAPGSSVSLLTAEAGLFTEPAGGFSDLDPFEANSILRNTEKLATATVGPGGTVDVPVTLTRTDRPDSQGTGLNHVVAVVKDAGGRTGDLSNVLVLELEEGTTPPPPPPPPPPGDKTAPQTTLGAGPPAMTNSRAATFAFASSEPGSAFRCSLDGAAPAACGSPKSYADLADGRHSLRVWATDVAGNTDATPAAHAWTVDTVRPRVFPKAPSSRIATRDRTPLVKAVVRDAASNLVKPNIRLFVDGKKAARFSYNPTTDVLRATTGRLKVGKHSVKVVAKDAAGNRAAKTWSFKVR